MSSILWESKERVWEINWTSLKHEFANWQPPWNVMKIGDFIKSVIVSLMLFLASNWDVLSDGQVAHLYITGTNYDYSFYNQTDPTIAELNCTYKGQIAGHNIYRYKCFKLVTRSQSSNGISLPGMGSHDTGEKSCIVNLSNNGRGNLSSLSSVINSLSSPLNFQTLLVGSDFEVTTAYVFDSKWYETA